MLSEDISTHNDHAFDLYLLVSADMLPTPPSKRQKNQNKHPNLLSLPDEILIIILLYLNLSAVNLLVLEGYICTRFWKKNITPKPGEAVDNREVWEPTKVPKRWSLVADVARQKLKGYDVYHPLLHRIPNPKKCYIWILHQFEELRSGTPFFCHYADKRLASITKLTTTLSRTKEGLSKGARLPVATTDPIVEPVSCFTFQCMNGVKFYAGLIDSKINKYRSGKRIFDYDSLVHHLFNTNGHFCGSNNALKSFSNVNLYRRSRVQPCPCGPLKKYDMVSLVFDRTAGNLYIYRNGFLCNHNMGVMAHNLHLLQKTYCWALVLPAHAKVQIIPHQMNYRYYMDTYYTESTAPLDLPAKNLNRYLQ